jgi:hypothetical protein
MSRRRLEAVLPGPCGRVQRPSRARLVAGLSGMGQSSHGLPMPRMRHLSTGPDTRARCERKPVTLAISLSVKASNLGAISRLNHTSSRWPGCSRAQLRLRRWPSLIASPRARFMVTLRRGSLPAVACAAGALRAAAIARSPCSRRDGSVSASSWVSGAAIRQMPFGSSPKS